MTFQNPPSGQKWNGNSFAVLGDSFSTGFGCSIWSNNWAERLNWLLHGDYPNGASAPLFYNHAKNGAMAEDHLIGGRWYQGWGRLVMDKIASTKASMIIVALGANEYGSFNKTSQYYADKMRELTRQLRIRVPDGNILYLHTPGFFSQSANLYREYWWVIQDLVRENNNTSYLDLSACMPWADAQWPYTYYHYDNVHINDNGHAAMAGAVLTHLRSL